MGHAPTATPPIGQFSGSGLFAWLCEPRACVSSSARLHGDCALSGLLRRLLRPVLAILRRQVTQWLRARLWRLATAMTVPNPARPAVGGDQSELRSAASQSSGARLHGRPAAAATGPVRAEVVPGAAFASYADAAAAQRAAASDQPTIYLIALRDHTIVQALGYWMEGSTLHYVSAEQR